MENTDLTFKKISVTAESIGKTDIKKILLLYEEKLTSIGDTCIRFDKLRYFRSFLNNATIHMNFTNRENYRIYDGYLINNPHIDKISTFEWSDIDFKEYDAIFCMMYDEEKLLKFLHGKYGDLIANNEFRLAVFSFSNIMLRPRPDSKYIFPVNEDLINYVKTPRLGEVYISAEEQHWADGWLKEHGLSDDEQLFVILDSTSVASKLLNINVYFRFLISLLSQDKTRILVFDERNIGKEVFYQEGVGKENIKKMIFSKGFTLRQNLCLIASKYTRLVFGPCTGVMHGASGIYNNYVRNGMDKNDVPLMIVYTGRLGRDNYNVNEWWGNSPLINCLLLMRVNNNKEIVLLNNLPEEERESNNSLPCSEYTPEILVDFVNNRLRRRELEQSNKE